MLQKLKENGAKIRYCGKTLNSVRSIDTYPLIQNEVIRTHSSSIQVHDIMTGTRELPTETTKLQFLTAFETFQSEVGHNPHDPAARPSMIWELVLAPDGELFRQLSIPDEYTRGGYAFRSHDGTPAISATITPPGTISRPHICETGTGTLWMQLFGRNVLIVWPPTRSNLKWFGFAHRIACGAVFHRALEHLETPECIILEQGQYEVLGPGYIYGILSATSSAIARVPVVHESMSADAELAMEWESELVERRETGTQIEKDTVMGIKSVLRDARLLWRQLDTLQGKRRVEYLVNATNRYG